MRFGGSREARARRRAGCHMVWYGMVYFANLYVQTMDLKWELLMANTTLYDTRSTVLQASSFISNTRVLTASEYRRSPHESVSVRPAGNAASARSGSSQCTCYSPHHHYHQSYNCPSGYKGYRYLRSGSPCGYAGTSGTPRNAFPFECSEDSRPDGRPKTIPSEIRTIVPFRV